jgi:hypothetical protein
MIDLRRYVLGAIAVVAMLAGCGGTQPLPTSVGLQALGHAPQGTSLMLPGGTSGDLLYVTTLAGVKSYSYPKGKHVGTLKMFQYYNFGICSDKEGDIFIDYGKSLLEYKHGGKKPIQSFTQSGYYVYGCASDPTTGNLAVTWDAEEGSRVYSEIAVYQNASGTPALYSLSGMAPTYCGYDDKSNLFCDGLDNYGNGFLFAELPKGGTALGSVSLNQTIGWPGSVQWDGKYVTVQDGNTNIIYGFTMSGSTGTLKRTVTLDLVGKQYAIESPLIVGKKVMEATIGIVYSTQPYGYVNFYKYPEGGSPTKTLTVGDDTAPSSLAVSVAPSGTRIHR